ncbi:hypothetical protein [Micromonospora sp. NPDC023814]|uniref:hypothetical protein n=1 Tax=Micromonospora sp. NPDC023814 TaxID=3154596 RepID=UPI0033F7B72C
MKIDVSASGLNDLVAHLDEVPETGHFYIRKAVQFTANGIKKTAQGFASGIAHAPDYPRAITYDTKDRGVGDGVSAEIGPDKDRRQGALGNILEYGTVNNPPYAHLGPALDRWSPDFVEGLEKAAADALERL